MVGLEEFTRFHDQNSNKTRKLTWQVGRRAGGASASCRAEKGLGGWYEIGLVKVTVTVGRKSQLQEKSGRAGCIV